MTRFQLSKNQRLITNCGLFAGYFIISSLMDDVIHVPFYVGLVVSTAFLFGSLELLSMVFGGITMEQTYSFSYPMDTIFNIVPRVIESTRWRLSGKIMETDIASHRYVVKFGWGRWGAIMTIKLSRLDDATTAVNVLCTRSNFLDMGSMRMSMNLFLSKLYNMLGTSKRL